MAATKLLLLPTQYRRRVAAMTTVSTVLRETPCAAAVIRVCENRAPAIDAGKMDAAALAARMRESEMTHLGGRGPIDTYEVVVKDYGLSASIVIRYKPIGEEDGCFRWQINEYKVRYCGSLDTRAESFALEGCACVD